MGTSHPNQKPWWQSPAVLIFLVLGAVVAFQILLKPRIPRQVPGLERGDIRLKCEDLPFVCAGWKQVAFTAPEQADQLPDGQFWWVHQWSYSDGEKAAGVCFDQLGLNDWHELTACYQALGWHLEDRAVETVWVREMEQDWKYVVAMLENADGANAVLVFSLFYDDGSPVEPVNTGLSVISANRHVDTQPMVTERIFRNAKPRVVHTRSLQCQVFAEVQGTGREEFEKVIELHLASRMQFRKSWIEHAGLLKDRKKKGVQSPSLLTE